MEYGFCEFFNKDMPMMDSFFRSGSKNNVLGLRKMNVRISNILFPECSTLMPNLAYFYYLHAIYHNLKEINDKREPTEKEINRYETALSKIVIEYQKERRLKTKGFFDRAEKRAYHWYKSSFTTLHFKDPKWKASEKCSSSQHEILVETIRYNFVTEFMKIGMDRIDSAIKAGWSGENGVESIIKEIAGKISKEPEMIENVMDRLDGIEKMDFIRRLVQGYDINNSSHICKYSYLSNIVMDIMNIKRIGNASKVFKTDDLYNYIENQKKPPFNFAADDQQIPNFLSMRYGANIVVGYGKEHSRNMYDRLRIAQSYSILQRIAKNVYNYILFSNNAVQKEEIERDLKKWFGEYNKNLKRNIGKKNEREPNNDELRWNWKKNSKYMMLFCNGENKESCDEDLLGIYNFIRSVGSKIPEDVNEDFEDFDTEIWFKELCEIVIEREKEVMGSDALLNSGFAPDRPFADYIDTFRWEYRPQEIEDLNNSEIEEDREDVQETDSKTPHNMCAKYFIYELFYER